MNKQTRSNNSRNDILDAAWKLIAKQGAEVSLSGIAKEVGVSRQAIYMHFGTRGGLLMALVKRADDRFQIFENFAEAMAETDPIKRLEASLKVWLEFVINIQPVASELIRLCATDKDAAAAWEDRMTDARRLFSELTQSLKENDILSDDLTPLEAGEFMWISASVQVWNLMVHDRKWLPGRAQDVIISNIKNGILKP